MRIRKLDSLLNNAAVGCGLWSACDENLEARFAKAFDMRCGALE
jgi:hypothetical protein